MNKTLLFLTCLLIPISGYSQTQIEGLGKLRINMHENEFLEMLASNYYGKPIVMKSSEELPKANDRKVYKLNFNIVNERIVFYARCKKAGMYYLKSFSIGDNIEMKEVYVTFFDSSLLDIIVEFNEDLRESLFKKYGVVEPAITANIAENLLCENAMDISAEDLPEEYKHEGKFRLSSLKRDYYFRNDDAISAVASERRFYDENCKILTDDAIRIYDKNALREFAQCH